MTGNLFLDVLGLLFGTGIGAVVIKALLDRRKSPLDRAQVLSAMAAENIEAALAIAQEARTTSQEANARAKEANGRSSVLESEVLRLQSTVTILRDWAAYIVRNWAEVRSRDTPPALPPEAHH